MVWKDQLLPGASRIPLPYDGNLLPGWVNDFYGAPTERNDWVSSANGPVISGSSEAQPGAPSNGGAGNALYAALSSQQGQAAQARAFADANLAQLHQSILASQGPTIGGHDIEAPSALPFLQALGIGKPKSQEEEERERLQKIGLGANIPA
jgi:hypothetical protein